MTITLLTDFGSSDYYVAAMKGVILSAAPDARIVDITHDIRPGKVQEAAFVLEAASSTFPDGTVHVAVVDPGVGSPRRGILVSGRQSFVGPDNGLFTFVLDADPNARVIHLTNESYFRHSSSRTFHGRDVFAPVAAALINGIPASQFGRLIDDPVRLPSIPPHRGADGVLVGRVLHVDHFGNCVTNLPAAAFPADTRFSLRIGETDVRRALHYYGEGGTDGGEPFVIIGSAGYLEVSVNGGSAAEQLGVRAGSSVLLRSGASGLSC